MDKKKNWREDLGGTVNKYGNLSTNGSWGGVSAMKPAALEVGNQSTPSAPQTPDYASMSKEYMDQYLKRKPFEFDVNADMLYQQYRKQAAESGRMAMEDTMARAAAMTGGYGNSYAMAAGQKAYQKQLDTADQMIPELYQLARSRYDSEGQDLLNKASAAASMIPQKETEDTQKGMSVADAMLLLGSDPRYKTGTTEYQNALYQLVNGGITDDFTFDAEFGTSDNKFTFSSVSPYDYTLVNNGGARIGKINDNAKVKIGDKEVELGALYTKLINEGMSETEALNFIIKIQENLGIKGRHQIVQDD